MAITAEREVARADMNDSYGVAVWQERKLVDYSTEEARALAAEIVRAADEADRVEREDRDAAFASEGCRPFGFDRDRAPDLTAEQAVRVAGFELDKPPTRDPEPVDVQGYIDVVSASFRVPVESGEQTA